MRSDLEKSEIKIIKSMCHVIIDEIYLADENIEAPIRRWLGSIEDTSGAMLDVQHRSVHRL